VGATAFAAGRGCGWGAVLTMTPIAGSGFAATNIGDTAHGSANVADERAALIAKLQRLQRERAAINEAPAC
jgi:hypothetical protein